LNWPHFILFLIIGFAAQLIDGTLGMAYGISCRTFLRTIAGVPPAVASAVVHVSEVPTTLVSGIAHIRFKNVEWDVLWKLAIPGVVGGILGAWLLTNIGDALEPIIDVYLVVMGFIILLKAFRKPREKHRRVGPYVFPLGFAGGFLDAAGGGGWGPVVTSTMLATDHEPKKTIGTVNTTEFFVTLAQSTAFMVLIQDFRQYWQTILALIIGGVCAAPLAAWFCKKCPLRPLLAIVGTLIMGLNVYNLIHFFAL